MCLALNWASCPQSEGSSTALQVLQGLSPLQTALAWDSHCVSRFFQGGLSKAGQNTMDQSFNRTELPFVEPKYSPRPKEHPNIPCKPCSLTEEVQLSHSYRPAVVTMLP